MQCFKARMRGGGGGSPVEVTPPQPAQRKRLPHGSPASRLRSGGDRSLPSEGGQGGAHFRNIQGPGSDGISRNPWEAAFANRERNPLPNFEWLKVYLAEYRLHFWSRGSILGCPLLLENVVRRCGRLRMVLGHQRLWWVPGDRSI